MGIHACRIFPKVTKGQIHDGPMSQFMRCANHVQGVKLLSTQLFVMLYSVIKRIATG